MKVTNLYNLPEPLYQALAADRYERQADYSITELIAPPQYVQLKRRYWDLLEEDATERIWILLGAAVHAILHWSESQNTLREETLTLTFPEGTISGTPDLLVEGGILYDYKVTSTWAVIEGLKPEWEAQVNGYAALYREHGFPVHQAFVIAILRDWSRTRSYKEHNYPKAQVQVIPVPLWLHSDVLSYFRQRLQLHRFAEGCTDEQLPPCSDEERWARPAKWAVMKPGRKAALRVFDTWEEAAAWSSTRPDATELQFVERPGGYPRCEEGYCPVVSFCRQIAREREKEKVSAA